MTDQDADVQKLRSSIMAVIAYRQHLTGCEINQTDFCSCGLREAMDALNAEWKRLILLCRYCGVQLLADGEGGWTCPKRYEHANLRLTTLALSRKAP